MLEYSESKPLAMKQLSKAEKYYPALDESFVIYRYGRILHEDMTDTQHHEGNIGLDAISILAYNNYFRQCEEKLEKAAHLHIEFWSKLNTQFPDVGELIMIGTKISKVIMEAESNWDQMQKINANMPKAVKMYASFLKEILHDEDGAGELLKSIVSLQIQKGGDYAQEFDSEQNYLIQTYGRGGSPCICVSGDSRSIGVINSVNSTFSRLAGYPKGRLIGMNLNALLPDCIALKHEKFLIHAIECKDEVNFFDKELLLPLKMSNKYIVMIYLTLKALPSFVNEMNFVATMKLDRFSETKPICYLLLDSKGYITDVSESKELFFYG